MGRFGLTRLSTFGILGDFTQQEVAQLLDALTAAGLVALGGGRPLQAGRRR